eukprot:TRINITY_DN6390_c0_g1_i3.p1 TRINITY_DN6390_c0_g1~~TRINITY_DN6390_c0_g1_i3.p1  ORF type:complete len:136 (-),score=27.91 TRINITY_DN6390_c0_g1_i3:368-775(-)
MCIRDSINAEYGGTRLRAMSGRQPRLRRRSDDIGSLSQEKQDAIKAGFTAASSYERTEREAGEPPLETIVLSDAKELARRFVAEETPQERIDEFVQTSPDGNMNLDFFTLMIATLLHKNERRNSQDLAQLNISSQ